MTRARFVCFFALILIAGIFCLTFTGISSAQLPPKESCPATLNGVDVRNIMTPGTALEVPYTGTVFAAFSSDKKIRAHQVVLSFAEYAAFDVEEAADDATAWSKEIEVAKYARYGVGLYQIRAETWGDGECINIGYVKVTGKNPLTSPVGAGAAAATVIGLAGMAGSAVTGSNKGPELAEIARQKRMDAYPDPGPMRTCLGPCAINIPMALLQTGAFMVSGAGTIGAPAVVVTPYLSIVSLAGSILAGLGTLVLGQQYALFFPTSTLSLLWIVGWIAAGIMITSLARLVAVRKANSILAKETVAETPDAGTAEPENESTES